MPGGGGFADNDFTYDAPPPSSAGAFGTFEDEEPLLQELGIDIPCILRRSRGILLNRLGANEMLSLDLGGPLFFDVLLGCTHLLSGKLHFGVILGWNVVASAAVWFVVNHLAALDGPHSQGLGGYDCCCLLGYCQVPLLIYALLALIIPRGMWSNGVALLAVLWASWTATKLFAYRSPTLRDNFFLVFYPCMLTYAAFVLLTIY